MHGESTLQLPPLFHPASRTRNVARRLLAAALLLALSSGCESKGPSRDPNDPASYTELILTKASTNEQVVNEVARLESAGLAIGDSTGGSLGASPAAVPGGGAAFHEQYPADEARSVLEASAVFYPAARFAFTPRQIELATDLRQANDRFVTGFRRYLQHDAIDFGLDMRHGMLARTDFLPVVRAAHRLEALEAAVMLERSQLDAAIDRLLAMLLISARLDDLPHLVPRLAAAELREEASRVLEAIANHSAADAAARRRLRDIVDVQLAAWPLDELAWQGDRAIGLHAYEMVRDGQLPSLLTDKEVETLGGDGKLSKAVAAIARNVDQDQEFYLDSMRDLIAACREPYDKRRQVIAEIHSQLRARRGTPEYPFVAGEILLRDLEAASHRQVADLALWRGLAMVIGTEGTAAASPPRSIDPLTDEPFVLGLENGSHTLELRLAPDRIRTISVPVR